MEFLVRTIPTRVRDASAESIESTWESKYYRYVPLARTHPLRGAMYPHPRERTKEVRSPRGVVSDRSRAECDLGDCTGEHIDYCGFSVLPAAVDKDVLIAFSTTSPSSSSSLPSPSSPGKTVFVLRNVESKYTPTSFEVDLSGNGQDLKINTEEHHWSNYFIAGLKGILTHLAHNPQKSGEGEGEKKKGLPERVCVMVNGTVPEGSGLSSSSAMTTASAMCVLDIVGRRDGEEFVNRRDVTNVAIEGGKSHLFLFFFRRVLS